MNKRHVISFNALSEVFINVKNWYTKSRSTDISFRSSELTITSTDPQPKYITLLENNTSFGTITNLKQGLLLHDTNSIHISAEQTKELQVVTYLIEYDKNGTRIKTNKVPLNKQKVIKKESETVYGRLAIRLTGEGQLLIKGIQTTRFTPVFYPSKRDRKPLKDISVYSLLPENNTELYREIVDLHPIDLAKWETQMESLKPDLVLLDGGVKLSDKLDGALEIANWSKVNSVPVAITLSTYREAKRFLPILQKFDLVILTKGDKNKKMEEPLFSSLTTSVSIIPFTLHDALNRHLAKKLPKNIIVKKQAYQWICRVLETIEIAYEGLKEEVSLLFKVKSKDDFEKAITIITSQTYSKIKAVIVMDLFDGYESIFNQYNNEIIAIFIGDYAERYYTLKEMVDTKYAISMDVNKQYSPMYIAIMMSYKLFHSAEAKESKDIIDVLTQDSSDDTCINEGVLG